MNFIYQKQFLSTNEMVIHYQYAENHHIKLKPIDMHICVDLSPYMNNLIVPHYISAYTDLIDQSKTEHLANASRFARASRLERNTPVNMTWTDLSYISLGFSGLCTTQGIEQDPYYINLKLDPSLRDMIHMAMFAAIYELVQNHQNSLKYMIVGTHLLFGEFLIQLRRGVLMIQGYESMGEFIDFNSCGYRILYDQIMDCLFEWKGREQATQYLLQTDSESAFRQ